MTKLLVHGTALHFRTYVQITWECPLTKVMKSHKGDLDYDLMIDRFIHDIYDELGILIYTVIA